MVLKAWMRGLLGVVRSPLLLLFLYLASLLLSLPLAFAMRQRLADSLGDSLVADDLVDGFDMGWYGEFSAHNPDAFASTFGPQVVGALPVVGNLERLLDGELLSVDASILTAAGVWLLLWTFLAGGMVDRFAHPEAPRTRSRLLAQGGEYFLRFLRLLGISVLLYLAIFKAVAEPLHRFVEEATRDVTEERIVLLWTLAVYGLVGLLLVSVKLGVDYAKIALVVEDRRSSVLAFLAGLRLVLRHPLKTFGLFFGLAAVGGALLFAYGQTAPGPGQRSLTTILLAFVVGQIYLALRILLKLWFLAAQTALFQGLARRAKSQEEEREASAAA